MKYLNDIKSFEDLKAQYKKLLKEHHPDNGGDVEIMKELNSEYEVLFKIWKDRHEKTTGETINDTADSIRNSFYTEFGWEGSNHSWHRSLKEVAVIVRKYVKEKYPTYKFSVRTSYASMCQELHVELKESPIEIYKTFDELSVDDKDALRRRMRNLFNLTAWNDEELKTEFERIWNEYGNYYKCLNEITQSVRDDVDAFVKSYNYEDCDGMIDYFDVDFYYFGCVRNNGENIKVVPKTARLPKSKSEVAKYNSSLAIEKNVSYTFNVSKDFDTRDLSDLWVVKVEETLSRDEYLKLHKLISSIGGYYSKFKHGFIFRFNPADKLNEVS